MIVKINVGGKIFETSIDTLVKINYFKYMINDTYVDVNDVIFVDRSGHIFKHVLALARDINYKYPYVYKDELDFYDMVYNKSQLYHDSNVILECVNIMEKKNMDIYKDHIQECNDCECENDICVNNKYGNNKCSRFDCDNESTNNIVCEWHEFKCDWSIMNNDVYYCDEYTTFITTDNKHYRCENHQ